MTSAWIGGAKTPPYSVHQEKAVLGGLLARPAQLEAVETLLGDEDVFFRSQHGLIWRAVRAAWSGRGERTIDAIEAALAEDGKLETVGGRKFLLTLQDGAPNEAMTIAAARQVFDKSRLRRLIDATSEILAEAYAGEHDVDELLARAQARYSALVPSKPAPRTAPRKKTARRKPKADGE